MVVNPVIPDRALRVPKIMVVTISSLDPNILCSGIAADGSINISGGGAVWKEDERPKRKSLTTFTGITPRSMSVGLLFDAEATGADVASECLKLRTLATVSDGYNYPPIVIVDGATVPDDAADIEWVISGLEWGPAELEPDGTRIRQAVVVSMVEFVEPDILIVKKNPIPVVPNYRLYKVRKGDTLPKVSTRLYKKSSRWREIAKLNKIRGPKIPRRFVGKRIKVPRR